MIFDGAIGNDGKFLTGPASGKTVEEVFGKAIAERILNEPHGKAEGDDLTIGGEGMKGFYDKILPA